MALTASEAIFVHAVIIHGNKLWAVREAFPRLEKDFEQAAIRYLMQNPEVPRHIDAGVLYMYRQIVKHTTVPEPQPLTVADKQVLLRMIISGERETPTYIVTADGLKMILAEPSVQEVEEAKRMLNELDEAVEKEWMI